MGLLTQLFLLCCCTFISESRVLRSNAGNKPIPLRLPHTYSLFPGSYTPHYPDDFDYENFYHNFFNWYKPNPNHAQNHQYPSLDNYNNHKSTTETTTTERYTDSTVTAKLPEPFLQSQEEVTIKDKNEPRKEEIAASSKENLKLVDKQITKGDEDHTHSDKSKVITSDLELKTNESYKSQTGTKSDMLSKSTEYDVSINMGQMDTIALPVGNMIMPAISIQSMNEVPPALNPVASDNPAGNSHGYPSLVVQNNEPANINADIHRSVPQAVPLNIPQNPVTNNEQPNVYNIAPVPNNAVNNMPNWYYIVSNNQAIPLNNIVQSQTSSQMYALVPIGSLGSNGITNQPGHIANQQNYGLSNQPSNLVAYSNQRENAQVNQPNNYVPLISQPNYLTFSNQPTNFVPLNNQENQYVTNQPNNLVSFSQPMVAENNNQPSHVLALPNNQPNNFVVLNSQPNSMVAVNNQPSNLVALNSGGNILQAQPLQNIVLYSLKDEDKEDNSDKKEEEVERTISNHDDDNIHPSAEPIEVVEV